MTNHRPLSNAEGDEYVFALKPEATTAAVPLKTKYMLICSACGVLYDGNWERACPAAGENPGQGEHVTPRYPEPNVKDPCPNCMGEGGDCPMCEGSGKIDGALDVDQRPRAQGWRPLEDSEVVNPCPTCSAPVFLLDGDPASLPHDYASQGPHTCPDVNERLNDLRCALHKTTIMGLTVYHEYPGHTEISAPWMQPPGGDSLGIVADPDSRTMALDGGEVVYSLITGHDSIPGPLVSVAWTDDVKENTRRWRAATLLAIGAVLRGVSVLMSGGDSRAAEAAMETPALTLYPDGEGGSVG